MNTSVSAVQAVLSHGRQTQVMKSWFALFFYCCLGCPDIDECSDNYFLNEYCGTNTFCTNTIGSFSCDCQLGHEAWVPGQGCCATNTEDSSCASDPGGTCQLTGDQGSLTSQPPDQSLYNNGVNSHWHIRSINWKFSCAYFRKLIFRVPNGKIIELTFTKFDVRLTNFIYDGSINIFFLKDWVGIWLSDSGVGVMFHWILWREAGGIFGCSGNNSLIIMSQITLTRWSILCSDSMTNYQRDSWEIAERQLRDCWETAERLLRDC